MEWQANVLHPCYMYCYMCKACTCVDMCTCARSCKSVPSWCAQTLHESFGLVELSHLLERRRTVQLLALGLLPLSLQPPGLYVPKLTQEWILIHDDCPVMLKVALVGFNLRIRNLGSNTLGADCNGDYISCKAHCACLHAGRADMTEPTKSNLAHAISETREPQSLHLAS